MKNRIISLSVILPALNEEALIATSLDVVRTYLDKMLTGVSYEVIVVAAKDKDNTAKVARNQISKFKNGRLIVIEPKFRVGKGRDVALGFGKATGEIQIFTDADLALPVENIGRIYKFLRKELDNGKEAAIFGVRSQKHSSILRKLISTLGSIVTRLLFATRVGDLQCGIKGFTKGAAIKGFSDLDTLGWAFDVEVFAKLQNSAIDVHSLEIAKWRNDSDHLAGENMIVASVKSFAEMLRIRLKTLSVKTFIRKSRLILQIVARIISNHFGLTVLVTGFFITGIALGYIRYNSFGNGFDFSVFNQAIWQLSHFQIPESTIRAVQYTWGDHFHPIIVAIAPFYAIFNSPQVLYVAQALLFAISVIPIYLFSLDKLKNKLLAIIISSSYIFYGAIQYALFFEFHEIAFALPLLGFAIYFFDKNKWSSFYWMIALLLFTKEDFGLIVAIFGILAIIFKRQIKRGLGMLIIGLSWFAILSALVMTKLAGGISTFNYWKANYDEFGTSPINALVNFVLHPIAKFKIAISELYDIPEKRATIAFMLKPFLFVFVLLSPYVLLAIPNILLRFWGNSSTYWDYHFHYGAVLSVILFMAFVDTLYRIDKIFKSLGYVYVSFAKNCIYLIAVFGLMYSVRNTYLTMTPYSIITKQNLSSTNSPVTRLGAEKVIALIPRDASVTAVENVVPLISNRDKIYILWDIKWWDRKSNLFLAKTPNTEYILYNDSLADIGNKFEDKQALLERIGSLGYVVSYQDDRGWIIFRKN